MKNFWKKKNKWIVGVFIALLIALITIIVWPYKSVQEKLDSDPFWGPYLHKTGYKIVINPTYIISKPAYPKSLLDLEKDVPVVTFATEAVSNNIFVTEYLKRLKNQYNINIDENALSRQYLENNAGSFAFLNGGGTIQFGTKDNRLTAAYLGREGFAEVGSAGYKYLNPYRAHHKKILGEPQAQYIDPLYNNVTVDFYFDKGLAFSWEYIIIFKPSASVDQDFIKQVGLQYVRTNLGTDGHSTR